MRLPHTITVYNFDDQDGGKAFHRTVLRGVLVDASRAANIIKSGMENTDAVTVYIPFSADAGGKTYLSPKEYAAREDKESVFTLRDDRDFFVLGVAQLDGDYQTVNGALDGVYRISSVDTRNYGSADMQHWQVGGR